MYRLPLSLSHTRKIMFLWNFSKQYCTSYYQRITGYISRVHTLFVRQQQCSQFLKKLLIFHFPSFSSFSSLVISFVSLTPKSNLLHLFTGNWIAKRIIFSINSNFFSIGINYFYKKDSSYYYFWRKFFIYILFRPACLKTCDLSHGEEWNDEYQEKMQSLFQVSQRIAKISIALISGASEACALLIHINQLLLFFFWF